MNTLIFFGSPRKNGHTHQMLEVLAEHLEGNVEIIDAYRTKNVSPCMDCRHCWKVNKCAIQDGMQEIYEKVEAADTIVIATPMYFHSIPGPLKIILDRLQLYWSGHVVRKDLPKESFRKGALLMTGGAPAFDGQFDAGEFVLNGILQDLNAECAGVVSMPNTDHDSLETRPDLKEQILALAEQLNR